ncbi:MAG: hypothetical protein GY765_15545, partial [bacterium]|nr:hypothetical protein [bacterium]
MLGGNPGLFAPPELNLMQFETLEERKNGLSGQAASHLQGTIRSIMELKGCDTNEAADIMEGFENDGVTVKELFGKLQQWSGDRLLVDKTPGYSMDIGNLQRMESYFDAPRYIHLVRHPYGMIRSYVEARMDLLIGQQVSEMLSVSRLEMAELTWAVSEMNILEFLKDIPRERKLFVRFEDLVADPEGISKDICRFLDVPYHPGMVEPYRDEKTRMTDGLHSEGIMLGDMKFREHKKIDPAVADTWKKAYREDFLGDTTRAMAENYQYKMIREINEKTLREPTGKEILPGDSNTGRPRAQLLKKASEGDRNLFLLHDRSGDVGGYIEFCRQAGSEFNCWGITAEVLPDHAPRDLTIAETAEHYADTVKQVQPQGPYYVAGWSFGGTLAFQLVRSLEQRGEKVEWLTLFDSPGPLTTANPRMPHFSVEEERAFALKYFPLNEIEAKLNSLTDIGKLWSCVTDYMKSKTMDIASLKNLLMQREQLLLPAYPGLGMEKVIGYMNTDRTFKKARERYLPDGPIDAKVLFLEARASQEIRKESWDRYCNAPIRYFKTGGDHYSILRQPVVVKSAAIFDREIS